MEKATYSYAGYVEKDGYYFGSIFKYRNSPKDAIIIYKEITNEEIEYINSNKIDKLFVDGRQGLVTSLDFLKKLDDVKYLCIFGDFDVSPIYRLKKLKFLTTTMKNTIDLSMLPHLEWLSTSTPNYFDNIDRAINLKSLSIYNYSKEKCNPKIFKDIPKLKNLDTLLIANTDLIDLSFLNHQMNLQVLILMENRKLVNIASLNKIKGTLTSLSIILSRTIESYHCLKEMNQLVYLYLKSNKFIDTISFIDNMINLKSAVIVDSEIVDGDLTPLFRLNEAVVFPTKKHYHRKKEGLKITTKYTDLPSGERDKGDSSIDLWRRIHCW
jgi:hypothetical protein